MLRGAQHRAHPEVFTYERNEVGAHFATARKRKADLIKDAIARDEENDAMARDEEIAYLRSENENLRARHQRAIIEMKSMREELGMWKWRNSAVWKKVTNHNVLLLLLTEAFHFLFQLYISSLHNLVITFLVSDFQSLLGREKNDV